jgi:hypothetical protein
MTAAIEDLLFERSRAPRRGLRDFGLRSRAAPFRALERVWRKASQALT